MAYLTSEIMEQYLHCPRYFYLYRLLGIRLTNDSIWNSVEKTRNDITFQYISSISTFLGIQIGDKVKNLQHLEKLLPLDYSCVLSHPNQIFSNKNVGFQVYAFLNFILLSICQENKTKGKKKRFPVCITFLPQPKDSQGIISESPTAIIDYSDSKKVIIHQKFSLPVESGVKNPLKLLNSFLAHLFNSNITRIITIDYRTTEILFDSISSYRFRKYKSDFNKLLEKYWSQTFEPLVSSSCTTCEFRLGCEVSEEVISHG